MLLSNRSNLETIREKFSLLAVTLLLAACNTPANSNPPRLTAAPSPLATAQLPDVQCKGEIPVPLKATLGNYRLAQAADFVASIRNFKPEYTDENFTCAIFTADFNEDRLKDYALLLVNQTTSDFRFQITLNQGNGHFTSAVVRDYKRLTQPEEGVIYTSMKFKPAGAPGLALHEYMPLKQGTPERRLYEQKAAIGLWKAILTNADGSPKDLSINTLGYCSEAFYLGDGKEKNFIVCD